MTKQSIINMKKTFKRIFHAGRDSKNGQLEDRSATPSSSSNALPRQQDNRTESPGKSSSSRKKGTGDTMSNFGGKLLRLLNSSKTLTKTKRLAQASNQVSLNGLRKVGVDNALAPKTGGKITEQPCRDSIFRNFTFNLISKVKKVCCSIIPRKAAASGSGKLLTEADELKAKYISLELHLCFIMHFAIALRQYIGNSNISDGYHYLNLLAERWRRDKNFLADKDSREKIFSHIDMAKRGRNQLYHDNLGAVLNEWDTFLHAWIEVAELINASSSKGEMDIAYKRITEKIQSDTANAHLITKNDSYELMRNCGEELLERLRRLPQVPPQPEKSPNPSGANKKNSFFSSDKLQAGKKLLKSALKFCKMFIPQISRHGGPSEKRLSEAEKIKAKYISLELYYCLIMHLAPELRKCLKESNESCPPTDIKFNAREIISRCRRDSKFLANTKYSSDEIITHLERIIKSRNTLCHDNSQTLLEEWHAFLHSWSTFAEIIGNTNLEEEVSMVHERVMAIMKQDGQEGLGSG